jgi:hypothetical protein
MYVLRAVHVSYNKLDHIGVHEEAEERRLGINLGCVDYCLGYLQ